LTEERWFHVTKHHPELRKLRRLVLRTLAQPGSVFLFAKPGDFAAVAQFAELTKLGLSSNLVVHYRELSNQDGFIVTAFPISKTRMRRKFSRWLRLK